MKHNDDDRLTPEERAVIEAALEWYHRGAAFRPLGEAVDAYRKATAPPEPFERWVHRWGPIWDDAIYDAPPDPESTDGQIWRCTVTPIERVR